MRKRPLCLAAVLLAVCILAAQRLGISWIWRSPAGAEPERWAEGESPGAAGSGEPVRSVGVKAEGTVYRQEQQTYRNKIVTYLYVKQTTLYLNSKKYPIRNIKCEIEGEQDQMLGCRLRAEGKLTLPESPGNPGEFDRRNYERAGKIDFYLKDAGILARSEPGGLTVRIEEIRKMCRDSIRGIFPEREAGVLEAMLLGEKELLEEDIKSGFQAAGISHIMAISGLHISMLGIGIWSGLKWLGLPVSVSSVCSLLLLAGYGVLIGSPVTALRALLMFGLMLGAKLLGRTYDLLSALAAAAILLLLDNPDLLWNSGFQMSFVAVAGMGSYGEFQRELWKRIAAEGPGRSKGGIVGKSPGRSKGEIVGKGPERSKGAIGGKGLKRIKRVIAGRLADIGNNLAVGWALWIFMLPVVLHAFYQVSVLGIFCNLLVLPLMPAVLGSGFLALLLGHWDPGIGSVAGVPAYGVIRLYEKLGELAGSAPLGMWTPGRPSLQAVVFYYAILAVSCGICAGILREEACRYARAKLAAVNIAALSLALLLMAAPWRCPDRITVLDVGQGDGIVLQTGHVQALVDGGSTSRTGVGKYVILPYLKYEGISCLEGIFVTHPDQDHISGIREVLQEARKGWLTVERIFFPAWMEETQEGRELVRLAENCGAACVFLRAGDELRMGKAAIRVLYPKSESCPADPNAGSLVFTWELDGMRALFTGDLPGEEERRLQDQLSTCTVLKTAHHGSRYSTTEEFLERVRPEIALISCGKKNLYGHPGAETIERLENMGSRILRTDEQGALTVTREKNGWRAQGFCDIVK